MVGEIECLQNVHLFAEDYNISQWLEPGTKMQTRKSG
jgi:hypothetical protein